MYVNVYVLCTMYAAFVIWFLYATLNGQLAVGFNVESMAIAIEIEIIITIANRQSPIGITKIRHVQTATHVA